MKHLFSNEFIKIMILCEIGLILIYPIVLFFKFGQIPDQVPLFYSRPRGVEQLTSSSVLFYIPIFNILIAFIHLLVAKRLYKKEPIMTYYLVGISLCVTFIALIGFLRTIFLIS